MTTSKLELLSRLVYIRNAEYRDFNAELPINRKLGCRIDCDVISDLGRTLADVFANLLKKFEVSSFVSLLIENTGHGIH